MHWFPGSWLHFRITLGREDCKNFTFPRLNQTLWNQNLWGWVSSICVSFSFQQHLYFVKLPRWLFCAYLGHIWRLGFMEPTYTGVFLILPRWQNLLNKFPGSYLRGSDQKIWAGSQKSGVFLTSIPGDSHSLSGLLAQRIMAESSPQAEGWRPRNVFCWLV